MKVILGLIIAVLVIVVLYLLCLRPNTGRREAMKPFCDVYIAHRGFFNNEDVPENSLPAFAAAVERGYGIELDVQLTADGRAVVFHDATLLRMCGVAKKVAECTYEELRSYALAGTKERIPLFTEVLDAIGGKVPLVVEIKSSGAYIKTAAEAAAILDRYNGKFCVESFHPMVIRWYKKNRPQVIRGQLSTDYKKDGLGKCAIDRFVLSNLLFNGYTRPDFIAYNHKYAGQFSFRLCRRLYKVVCAAWTVKSEAEMESVRGEFEVVIFEGFEARKGNLR